MGLAYPGQEPLSADRRGILCEAKREFRLVPKQLEDARSRIHVGEFAPGQPPRLNKLLEMKQGQHGEMS